MKNKIDPTIKVEDSTKIVEPTTTLQEDKAYLHDKRYEKPFENDGAYADDDIE